MGCWHRCGPWHGGVYCRDWPPEATWDPYEYEDWPIRRRSGWRGRRPVDRATAAEALEDRLADLRAELERVETALAELRQPEAAGTRE
jgi:hypothetical protein